LLKKRQTFRRDYDCVRHIERPAIGRGLALMPVRRSRSTPSAVGDDGDVVEVPQPLTG